MNYYIYGYTSKGSIRSKNEDRILVDGKIRSEGRRYSTVSAPFVAAVCDGVGGEKAGELAAQTCLEDLAKVRYRSDVDIKSAVYDIHLHVKKNGVVGKDMLNMQTTLCALAVDEKGDAICINVGDSRMYRYINAAIRQISTDQSYRQFIYEHGSDNELEQMDPKMQNAIVSSIGSLSNDPQIELTPLVTKFGNEPDDMILIVSDGITDFVSEQQLEIGMGLDLPIGQKLEAIAQLAVDNGSEDNVSIVGIKPYITKQELEAITSDKKGETVNIQKLIAETDELGDILTLDINEIISKPYPKQDEQEIKIAPAAERQKVSLQPQTKREQDSEQKSDEGSKTELENVMTDTQEVVMTVEKKEQTTAQETGITIEEHKMMPDEPVNKQETSGQLKENHSQIEKSACDESESVKSESTGKNDRLDFSFHTVELLHQSASSLARLEKLFGKK